jgi:hypothetical protein
LTATNDANSRKATTANDSESVRRADDESPRSVADPRRGEQPRERQRGPESRYPRAAEERQGNEQQAVAEDADADEDGGDGEDGDGTLDGGYRGGIHEEETAGGKIAVV